MNAKRQRIELQHDNFGRLHGLTNQKGEHYQFDYDNCHRLIREFDFAGQKKCYDYNLCDKVIKLSHYPNPSARDKLPTIVTEFERDAIGRLTARRNADYHIDYGYLADGVQIKRATHAQWQQARQQQRSPDYGDELEFSYDVLGQLLAEKNHSGTYRYHYDEIGSLLSTVLPDGEEIRHLYYGGGHLLQSDILINGQRTLVGEYQRDSLHREVSTQSGRINATHPL